MRDISVSPTFTHQVKGSSKPSSTKHTISQQHQVNFNQTQTQQQPTTKPNYQPKTENNRFNMGQTQQTPQDFMNFQNMNPYQWMYMMMNPYMVKNYLIQVSTTDGRNGRYWS
jgi:hypothetical protein